MGKVKCTFKEWTLAINQEVSCSTSSTDDNRDDVGDNDAGDDGDDEHSNAL